MAIVVTCRCGKKYQLKDALAGKRAKCTACGQKMRVPKLQRDQEFDTLFDDLGSDDLAEVPALPTLPSRQHPHNTNANGPLMVAGVASVVVIVLVALLVHAYWPSNDTQSGVAQNDETMHTVFDNQIPKQHDDNNAPAPRTRPSASEKATDPLATIPVEIVTNVHGATMVVRDVSTNDEFARAQLLARQRSHEFHLDPNLEYECEARIGERVVEQAISRDERRVKLNFDPTQIREICRAAVCLIKLPEGGLGSGFLFGDRQTIVTAAHVLTTKTVKEIDIIFSPAEEAETAIRGAQLIYFDANQDVALLRLAKPVEDERPFLWRMEANPEELVAKYVVKAGGDDKRVRQIRLKFNQRDVIAIGNPGRGDDYDPLYIRKAKIVSGRPDEFQIDIELKPGYSGGPICLSDTGQVAGLVSYKIVAGAQYEDVGRTFAKSVALADDALENWTRMSPQRQQTRVDRLMQRFARQYGYRCALNAAVNLYIDSAVYTRICVEVAVDYQNYMAAAMNQIPPNVSPRVFKLRMKKVHRKYIRVRAPEKAKEVRDKVSANLREETEKWYQEAISDETLPDTAKDELKKAYASYEQLKDAAEQIVTPGRSTYGGKNIDEFLESTIKWWNEASADSLSVINAATRQME